MPARARRTIRYAVVGLGHIAQVAVLPAFANAKRNPRVVALVSDDATKLRELSQRGAKKLREVGETTAAILRFDGGRVASFVTSFNAADIASYRIVGSKGQLHVDHAYEYAEGLAYELTVDGKTTRKRIGKRDQFAPELLYFSDCVLENREPEPSGVEGLQDVRIVQALYESAETGKPVALQPLKSRQRPSLRQRITRPGIAKPRLVNVHSASEG